MNQFGALEFAGSGSYLFYPNQNNRSNYLRIKIDNTSINYTLSEGSFLHLDITTGNLTRFNASNGLTEIITPNDNYVSSWAISSNVNAILQSYYEFENAAHNPPNNFCYIPGTEVAIPCDDNNFDGLGFNSFSRNSCAHEQNYLNNHGYNGYPTLNACLRPAEQATMLAGAGFVYACALGPVSLGPCSLALLGVAVAAGNYNHTAYQCKLAHNTAQANLAICLDSPSNGGGSGGGNGGGVSIPPTQCYQVIQHGICTGGGCTYWSEIIINPC